MADDQEFITDALGWSGCHWGYNHVIATDVVGLLPDGISECASYYSCGNDKSMKFCNADSVHKARNELNAILRLRDELLEQESVDWARNILRGYESLRNNADLLHEQAFLEQLRSKTSSREKVKELCALLLSHPIWHVAETAASMVASLARYDIDMVREWVTAWLSERGNWRLHYGAIEVAFCIFQFDSSPAVFEGRPHGVREQR